MSIFTRRWSQPPGVAALWEAIEERPDGVAYRHRYDRESSVIISEADEQDGKRWVHLSMAHPHRLPTWAELARAKEAFLTTESKAIMVLPPRKDWVNIHEFCLHLWWCLDGDELPDFTQGQGSI